MIRAVKHVSCLVLLLSLFHIVKERTDHRSDINHPVTLPGDDSCMSFDRRRNGVERTGGAKRDRTADLLRARQALSQLSYGPSIWSFCFPDNCAFTLNFSQARHLIV